MSKKKAEAVEVTMSTGEKAKGLTVSGDSQEGAEAFCLMAIEALEESTGRKVLSATLTRRTSLANDSGRTTSERVFEIELSE